MLTGTGCNKSLAGSQGRSRVSLPYIFKSEVYIYKAICSAAFQQRTSDVSSESCNIETMLNASVIGANVGLCGHHCVCG